MRKNKVQRDYKKAMNELQPDDKSKKMTLYKLFHNPFTQSRFFFYAVRIILVLIVISLVNFADGLIYSLLDAVR